MNADLGITKAQFGLAAGLFSIGYFLFEVPSNMLMRKVGARKWIARILFSWGAVAVLTGFVHDFTQLAIARTVLGIAEAGFFPCVLLYLTLWFPERERARVVAQFMIALPVATLIAGPLSGMILDHVHWFGVESWRWVFILEGIPAVMLGFVTLFVLVDGPHKAKWLTRDEADWLTETIDAENRAKAAAHGQVSFLRSLAGIRTLSLSFIYYSKSVAIYVLAFFTPSIVAGLGDKLSNTSVGFITALPYAAAAIFMVWWARHSDRNGERRWHVGIPLLAAAAGLVSMVFVQDSLWFSVILLVVITVAVYATYGPFWALPSLFLTGPAAAVGLASINSLANLGGFVGPSASAPRNRHRRHLLGPVHRRSHARHRRGPGHPAPVRPRGRGQGPRTRGHRRRPGVIRQGRRPRLLTTLTNPHWAGSPRRAAQTHQEQYDRSTI